MKESESFLKLKFSDSQLSAIREIYFKYFAPKINEPYKGKGFVFTWSEGVFWKSGTGYDVNHNNPGYSVHECDNDTLWDNFSDLLPYMSKTCVVTKMPPGGGMYPHVDRKWRPEAIYIPIMGCSEKCVSKIYDMPLPESDNSTHIKYYPENFLYQYSIVDQPYLTNTHVWHSVQNFSDAERITFGWNFTLDKYYSYPDCVEILRNLSYINDEA